MNPRRRRGADTSLRRLGLRPRRRWPDGAASPHGEPHRLRLRLGVGFPPSLWEKENISPRFDRDEPSHSDSDSNSNSNVGGFYPSTIKRAPHPPPEITKSLNSQNQFAHQTSQIPLPPVLGFAEELLSFHPWRRGGARRPPPPRPSRWPTPPSSRSTSSSASSRARVAPRRARRCCGSSPTGRPLPSASPPTPTSSTASPPPAAAPTSHRGCRPLPRRWISARV